MNTMYTDIVLRQAPGGGYFAWLGLGSMMVSVLNPGLDFSARFDSRELAKNAAVSAIARLKAMALASYVAKRMRGKGIENMYSARVFVHEGPENTLSDPRSSWDLPVSEEIQTVVPALNGFPIVTDLTLDQRIESRRRRKKARYKINFDRKKGVADETENSHSSPATGV